MVVKIHIQQKARRQSYVAYGRNWKRLRDLCPFGGELFRCLKKPYGGKMEMNNNKKSQNKTLGIFAIVIGLAIITGPVLIGYFISKNDESKLQSVNKTNSIISNKNTCLNEAYSNLQSEWGAADTDGDGKLSYADGASDITTRYYDKFISCHRNYKTEDSEGQISDLQQKRQQEQDNYNTWLSTANQKNTTQCTSNGIGNSVYTTCY